MKQFKLTKDNIVDFLFKKARHKIPFEFTEIKERDEVSKWSNNNYLWRVLAQTKKGSETLFVKQAQEYNRRSVVEGQPIAVDPKRICGEYQLITFLRKIWGEGYVPKIYYFDPHWCITVMSDVSRGAKLLVEEFAQDKIHPELGRIFGALFGKLHGSTYRSRFECCGSINWRKKMYWLFEEHFATGIRRFVPEKIVEDFFKEVRCAPQAWIWGDAVHRNIFVRERPRRGETKISLVDFDHAQKYDPAVDCGMLMTHWMWMSLKEAAEEVGPRVACPPMPEHGDGRRAPAAEVRPRGAAVHLRLKIQSEKFIKEFWQAYEREFIDKIPPLGLGRDPLLISPLTRGDPLLISPLTRSDPLLISPLIRGRKRGSQTAVQEIKARALRWAGLYLVSRTDGISGSYFKRWPKWEEKIRKQGIELFLEKNKQDVIATPPWRGKQSR